MASRGRGARAKGFAFEREIAKEFSDATGLDFKRGLGQTRGGGNEVPDVLPPEGELRKLIHIECKRQKRCSIKGAMEQALNDIGKESNIPIVITKDDRKDALVTMKLEDWMPIFSQWLKNYNAQDAS